MKHKLGALLLTVMGFGMASTLAQPGGGPGGASFGGSISKIFGENKVFTTTVEIQAKDGAAGDTTIAGKLAFDDGKSRFEMDLGKMKNSNMPPGAIEQMKALGMDNMVVISRPDKKASYMIYPGLKAYAEMPLKDSESTEAVSKLKLETTELGKETVDGHPTIKNKVVVTDEKGKKQEFTVWNATDLKSFPVKLEMSERGANVVMLFKDAKLEKPAAALFDAPQNMTKYDDARVLMQTEMMKKMGGGGFGAPPGK